MKKKTLIKKLKGCPVTDENCKNLITRIEDTLLSFPDDVEIENFTSLNTFLKNGGLAQTTLSVDAQPRDDKTIQKELEIILNELHTWVARQVKSGEVYAAEAARLNQKRRINIILRFFVWGIFIAFAIIAAVFTGLRLKNGEDTYKWVPEIIGCADLIIGIGFAIYEQVDDYRNKKNHKNAQREIESLNGDTSVAKSVFGPAIVDNSTKIYNYNQSKKPEDENGEER